MNSWLPRFSAVLAFGAMMNFMAQAAPADAAVTPGAILVKGAWHSATDSMTPLPEEGAITNAAYENAYFGLAYPLGHDWTQRYEGPPPSDSGYYVLAQIEAIGDSRAPSAGHVLIAAQDLFFTMAPANDATELVNYYKDHLGGDYEVERAPVVARIAGRDFVELDYFSSAAGLHWHVLATEIRCHVLEFVFTGASTKHLDRLVQKVNAATLVPAKEAPICIKNYAAGENLLQREEPIFPEPRFNPVPVRIIIDREGRVRHTHYLSAFPEQARSISDALSHWRFKPYVVDGQAVEVETGITFGRPQRPRISALR